MTKLTLIFFFVFLFFVSFVAALDINECKGQVEPSEVPCRILLPINTSLTNCSEITISFYMNGSTFIYNQIMEEYNAFNCNATFNQTNQGSYTFTYSTGDSGSIIVERGELSMFSIIIGMLTVLLVFGLFGFLTKSYSLKVFGYGVAMIQLVNILFINYLNESGYSLLTILRMNFYIILILAFAIAMIALSVLVIRAMNINDK